METQLLMLEELVWKALENVKDPEIPAISVVDLGIISSVETNEEGYVKILMTPTFTACPATDFMRDDIVNTLGQLKGVKGVRVKLDFSIPWTSNMITEKGRQDLKDFGYAPPPYHNNDFDQNTIANIACPRCDGNNTSMNNIFGPALCRSMHYCHDCKEAFQQFKPI